MESNMDKLVSQWFKEANAAERDGEHSIEFYCNEDRKVLVEASKTVKHWGYNIRIGLISHSGKAGRIMDPSMRGYKVTISWKERR